jgi:RNA polymerase sigma-70 factor (ECF subfamily)
LVDEFRRRTRAAEVARVLAAERPPGDDVPERVEEAVARLPLLQRRLVFMRVVEERPYREIARELGCNEAACKMQLSRVLQRLRNELLAAS